MKKSTQTGFTAVEMIITIIVAAVFVIALYQLFGTLNTSMSASRQRAVASELAYSYLRRYTGTGSDPASWFVCSTASGTSNTNDYTVNTNAAGQTLTTGNLSDVNGLAQPISYKVTALAQYGCSGTNAGKPLRIEASVTYGPYNTTVKHVTLVGY